MASLSPEARALIELRELPGLGNVGVRRLVERFGSATAAMEVPDEVLRERIGPEAVAARSGRVGRDAVERTDRLLATGGATLLTADDPGWPSRLRELPDPPLFLFLRGNPDLLGRPSVAIVGARRATPYGRRTAYRLGRRLAERGLVVVSGMALGVDAEAHGGAAEAGKAPGIPEDEGGAERVAPTVAVLGCGIDRVHPRSNAELFEEVGRRGLLVTEFLPGAAARAHHFPRRNRILAALADAVVVVEAGARSGSLITASHALDLGREVWAVPGAAFSPASEGSNALLADGARLLAREEDLDLLVQEVGGGVAQGVFPLEPLPSGPPRVGGPPEGLAPVWEQLDPWTPRRIEEVAAGLGAGVERAAEALVVLEVEGWARSTPGGFLRARP